jgi:hypothetical protein
MIHAENLTKHRALMSDREKYRNKIREALAQDRDDVTALVERANALNPKIVEGDKSAAAKKLAYLDEKRVIEVRIAARQSECDSCDRHYEADAKRLSELQLYAEVESISENVEPKLARLANEISAIVAPLAEKVGEFKREFDGATEAVMPLIEARRHPATLRALRDKIQFCLKNGVLEQLSGDFHRAGLDLLNRSAHGPESFDASVAPVVRALIGLVNAHLPPDSGRNLVSFRCTTNVGGLFFTSFREGEILSLDANDPSIQRLHAAGALNRLDESAIARGAA